MGGEPRAGRAGGRGLSWEWSRAIPLIAPFLQSRSRGIQAEDTQDTEAPPVHSLAHKKEALTPSSLEGSMGDNVSK